MKEFICINCDQKFQSSKSYKNRIPKFCSRKCSSTFNCKRTDVRKKMSDAKIGYIPYNKLVRYKSNCIECNKEIENRLGAKYIKKFCSMFCRNENYKKRDYSFMSGINSHFYIHGNCTNNELQRKSGKYKNWRESVFKRDNYTCVICKVKGGVLNADHILSFAHYPDKRFDIDNGRTLCYECHKKTDNFGSKNIKK